VRLHTLQLWALAYHRWRILVLLVAGAAEVHTSAQHVADSQLQWKEPQLHSPNPALGTSCKSLPMRIQRMVFGGDTAGIHRTKAVRPGIFHILIVVSCIPVDRLCMLDMPIPCHRSGTRYSYKPPDPTFLGGANAHQSLRSHKRLEPKACGNDHTQLAHDKRMDCATDLTRTNHVESAAQVVSKERLHTWLWGAHPTSDTFKMFLINKNITTRSLHMTNGWTWCATDLTSTNHVESAAQVISKERLHTWLWGTHSI
jgi:hypothetical protein